MRFLSIGREIHKEKFEKIQQIYGNWELVPGQILKTLNLQLLKIKTMWR